jgi:hypothetical protein
MAETVSWAFTAASSSGAGIASGGSLAADGTTSASVQLDAAMASAAALTLQLDDVDRIAFLGIVPSLTDGSVEVQADGGSATKLTGPLMLFGAAVKLFAGDLTTLKAQNRHATKAATLSVLLGLKLGA